jgi:hypothetical protein
LLALPKPEFEDPVTRANRLNVPGSRTPARVLLNEPLLLLPKTSLAAEDVVSVPTPDRLKVADESLLPPNPPLLAFEVPLSVRTYSYG